MSAVVSFPNRLRGERWRGQDQPCVIVAPADHPHEWAAWVSTPYRDTLIATGTDKGFVYGIARAKARERDAALRVFESPFHARLQDGQPRRSTYFVALPDHHQPTYPEAG